MAEDELLWTRIQRHGGLTVVTVGGSLVAATAARLRRVLDTVVADGGLDRVVLDVRELAWADEAGLHMLATARANATRAGVGLVLANATPMVETGLFLEDLTSRLPCFRTLDEAIDGDGDELSDLSGWL